MTTVKEDDREHAQIGSSLVVLLGVLYGVYVALSKPEPSTTARPAGGDVAPLTIEFGGRQLKQPYRRLPRSYDEGHR